MKKHFKMQQDVGMVMPKTLEQGVGMVNVHMHTCHPYVICTHTCVKFVCAHPRFGISVQHTCMFLAACL